MATLKKGTIESSLEQKGFSIVVTDHKHFIYYTLSGKKTAVRTKTSHGSGSVTISDSLIGLMARQCKLTKGRFLDLINCPLSRPDYEQMLAQADHI